MILVIIFTLAALTMVGAIIYGVQQNKKKNPSVEALEAEIQQPAPEPVKAKPAPKQAKMSAKPKKSATKVTKTK